MVAWLFRKIKNGLRLYRNKGLSLMLAVGLRLRNPRLVAWALAGFTRPLDEVPKSNVRYRVLCMSRRIFVDDVRALNVQTEEIAFLSVNYIIVKRVYNSYMPDEELNDRNYMAHKKHYPARHKELIEFWDEVLPVWQRHSQFDAVLNGSFFYSSQVELAEVCVARGIPYIALHKEGMWPPNKLKYTLEVRLIKRRFYGARLLTINERIAEAFKQIPGVTHENITPVGIPRTDEFFQPYPEEGIHISLFLSLPAEKLFVSDEALRARLEERLGEFYATFIELAGEHPELSFVIKNKQGALFQNYFADLVQQHALRLGKNVTVTSEIEPATLLRASRLVLSYSSTVLFEALALGKPIAEPDFRKWLLNGDTWGEAYEQVTNYVTSREDMVQLIQNPEAYVSEPAARERVLRQYLYRTDGKASERINEILVAEIEKARERRLSYQAVLEGRLPESP